MGSIAELCSYSSSNGGDLNANLLIGILLSSRSIRGQKTMGEICYIREQLLLPDLQSQFAERMQTSMISCATLVMTTLPYYTIMVLINSFVLSSWPNILASCRITKTGNMTVLNYYTTQTPPPTTS